MERPFLLDNVWEILHLVDYLSERPDVDPERIGITGEYEHTGRPSCH